MNEQKERRDKVRQIVSDAQCYGDVNGLYSVYLNDIEGPKFSDKEKAWDDAYERALKLK